MSLAEFDMAISERTDLKYCTISPSEFDQENVLVSVSVYSVI